MNTRLTLPEVMSEAFCFLERVDLDDCQLVSHYWKDFVNSREGILPLHSLKYFNLEGEKSMQRVTVQHPRSLVNKMRKLIKNRQGQREQDQVLVPVIVMKFDVQRSAGKYPIGQLQSVSPAEDSAASPSVQQRAPSSRELPSFVARVPLSNHDDLVALFKRTRNACIGRIKLIYLHDAIDALVCAWQEALGTKSMVVIKELWVSKSACLTGTTGHSLLDLFGGCKFARDCNVVAGNYDSILRHPTFNNITRINIDSTYVDAPEEALLDFIFSERSGRKRPKLEIARIRPSSAFIENAIKRFQTLTVTEHMIWETTIRTKTKLTRIWPNESDYRRTKVLQRNAHEYYFRNSRTDDTLVITIGYNPCFYNWDDTVWNVVFRLAE